ncbi:MAG: TonB-dependent receptor [Steroidobacteraceae bacterium]
MSVKTIGTCVSAILALSAAAAVAQAQEGAAGEPARLEEVIVTAQKRAENLQTVPISVSAVTGDAIATQQILNISSLANSIPNVQINRWANSPDSAIFTIRGIGVNDSDPYVGTTVSVVVDGVPVGVNTAALMSLFDIDRVEILRGPQGTLFGANTTGGVVNVVTKQPTGELGGEAEVTVGNYGRLNANAIYNFPITDSLAGKISVLHQGHDGFFRNFDTAKGEGGRLGKTDITVLRGYLKYTADSYDATLVTEFARSRNGSQTALSRCAAPCATFVPGESDQPLNFRRGWSQDQPDQNNKDAYAATLTQNFDTAFGDVVSISSYREYNQDLFSDDDGTTKVLLQTNRQSAQKQYSQELRATIDINDQAQLVIGAFGFRQRYFTRQNTKLDGFLVGLGQPQLQSQTNWSISGFTQLYYKLTDQLRLQAGLRYQHEKTRALATTGSTLSSSPGVVYSNFTDRNFIPGSYVEARGTKSWNKPAWKLGLDYQITDSSMVYGTYSRGFKSGGFAGRITFIEDIGPFNPEKVDSFEVGVKTDLLDGRMRVNGDVFYNIYKNMQVTQNITYLDGRNSSSIVNAGKAKTKGAELEITALPIEGVTLSLNGAYLDATYDKYDSFVLDTATNTLKPISFAGKDLQNAPKWSGGASLSWTFPLGAGNANLFLQDNYTGSKFTYYDDAPQNKVGSINLVNASLKWTPESERWSASVYARNLFDKTYSDYKLYLPGTLYFFGMGNPREVGVTFNFNW